MRKLLFSLGAGVASVALLTGCSGSLYLDKSEVETNIATWAEEQSGDEAEVTCAEDLPGEVGAQTECDMELASEEGAYTVQVTTDAVDTDTKEIEYQFEVLD